MDLYKIFSFLLFPLLFLISYLLLFSKFSWAIDKIKYLPITLGVKRNDRTPETAYNVEGESPSTSNTLNLSPERKYHVFLSFAGKDTRLNFTDHLYEAFCRSGIRCFKDEVDLDRGEDINYLFQAIQDSLCAILVISTNYAKSTWCLDELQKILESREKLGRRVFPIFYNVDPADVRRQRGSFGEALAKLEKKCKGNTTKVQSWRTALSKVGDLSGWVTKDKYEADLIKNIVGEVWRFLSTKLPSFDDNWVGIDSKVADMIPLLEIWLDDKRFVGIWGMGGVGKTTLARVVFEKLLDKFEICCFLENVKDALPLGLVSLQKCLLSRLKIKDLEIVDRDDGMRKIRSLLCDKKVLLVVDDIDDMSQLEYLAKSPDWFGKGSRIIITTRDSHVLTLVEVGQRIYEMKAMEKDESLRLFSNDAFRKDHPEEGYWELSKSVVEYAGGLPLALKVLGRYLHRRSEAEWTGALNRMKQVDPHKNILQVLKISYDGLDKNQQTIFLDVVCFFKHWRREGVTQILERCDLEPTIGIKVLIEKALLVESKDGTLEMHNLIEELGRYIVHQESPNDVYKRSRLWEFKDIKEVLENNRGSAAIRAISIEGKNRGRIKVHPETFLKMSSLRLLSFEEADTDTFIFQGEFKLPDTLIVVIWPSFPFEALPLKTPLNELIHVKMYGSSSIKRLWNVIQPMKLKFIDLSCCDSFIETPDFSRVPCLEHLYLRECRSLVKVHPSLGELKELVIVDLSGCVNLEILPGKLETNSLIKLDLGWCSKLAMLPEFGKGMEKLSYLDVNETDITRLPESFGSLTGLRRLNLSLVHRRICNLDDFLKIHVTREISSLKVMQLTELYLSGCGLNDGSIPDDFGSLSSLIVLDLSCNNFVNLPTACFSSLFRLLFLSLDCCDELESLPRLPPRLIQLIASHCESMKPLSSNTQLWNLVASLDHEYRGQTKYVISDEYNDTTSEFKHIELEHLPLRDFFANVPGYEIPSWFPNKCVPSSVTNSKHVIEVTIPSRLDDREWYGIVVCLHISRDFSGLISCSSKAPDGDYYVHKGWAYERNIMDEQNRHLCIMVLKLNERTCWQPCRQHLAGDNSLHIKLCTHNYSCPEPISKWECGWRVICKEEIQEWCHRNDFNQLNPPQLDPPHDEVKLPLKALDFFNGSVYRP
ncbi:hypothetical protein QN277_016594 [Acacia crassicarpa]|uniref:TIR domain-containing protein n=1 Tax=Acacia crassicarpa TaxID=499986 RepID=A0AAE1TCD2_9FABA|nr:hypothetical protein QN277_016594 [Acacia crassicarpa]